MRKVPFIMGEYYHLYNRGVDKRSIFSDKQDLDRFFLSMKEFNSIEPIGSIYEHTYISRKEKSKPNFGHSMSKKLVEFVCYCLNPNHYHFIVTPVVDNGIKIFMQRLGNGYTKYFNQKYNRSGALFQGRFKSSHISSNEYLLHASVYVNLNNRFRGKVYPLSQSSWKEFIDKGEGMCEKSIVLDQFTTPLKYKEFATSSLENIIARKSQEKELTGILLE